MDAVQNRPDDPLEAQLGPKLTRLLEERDAAALERDLRAEVNSPENRTMSSRTSRLFLALLLRRQGREHEAMQQLGTAAEEGLSISARGAWQGAEAAGYHMHDPLFADGMVRFFRSRGARTVADFGCGLGLYVRRFREAGFRAGGFDGNPATVSLTEGRCLQADLSRELELGTRWDWILSLEVAEHIPPEFEDMFLGNLDRHNRHGVVLSWANQAGEGHVNLRTRGEVESLFAARGYRSDEASASALRSVATLPWLQHTVMVFVRERPSPD